METPISYNSTNSFKTISPPPVVSESSHHQTPTRLIRPVPGRKHLPPSQNIIRAPSFNSTDRPVQIGSRNSSFSSPADFRLHSRNNTTSPKYLQLQQENQKLLQEISSLKAKLLEKDRLIDDLTKKLEKKQEPKTSQSMQKAPSSSLPSSVAKQHNRSQTPPQPRTPPIAETKTAKQQQQESITKESSAAQRSPKRLLSSRTLQQRKALSAKAIHITPSKSAPQKTKEEPKKHSPVNIKKKPDLSAYLTPSSRRLASSPTLSAVSASVSASTSTTKTSTSTSTTNNNKKNQTEDTSISAMLKKKRSKMQLRRSRTPIDGKVEEAMTTGNNTINNNNSNNKKTERMQPSQTRTDYDGSLNPLTPKASGNSSRWRMHKAESVNKVAEKNATTDKNVPKNNTVVTQNITLDIKKPTLGEGRRKMEINEDFYVEKERKSTY
eukprot:CAMPEP_0178980388 /NCGR_PEP_ID=MMETSP0789-20121207/26469_1 /TAXON_ID=3005 /ORGANISM="Rhizosolenia setigera, Strain CCMP 1694" /LENGTH=436 /DNA_ID=CAMNT_0020670797 /DNA_START=78 /DNA_END=1386 /DNA_ORIENTATION=-